jgi:hypothetical protein
VGMNRWARAAAAALARPTTGIGGKRCFVFTGRQEPFNNTDQGVFVNVARHFPMGAGRPKAVRKEAVVEGGRVLGAYVHARVRVRRRPGVFQNSLPHRVREAAAEQEQPREGVWQCVRACGRERASV